MTLPITHKDLSRAIAFGDEIFNATHIKDEVWLLEMHTGPRAKRTWFLAVDLARPRPFQNKVNAEVGRVSRPHYGFIRMRFDNLAYARNVERFEGHLEAPDGAYEPLVALLVQWIKDFY